MLVVRIFPQPTRPAPANHGAGAAGEQGVAERAVHLGMATFWDGRRRHSSLGTVAQAAGGAPTAQGGHLQDLGDLITVNAWSPATPTLHR